MRQLWTDAPEIIEQEMLRAVAEQLPLNLHLQDKPPCLVRACEVAGPTSDRQLVLAKPTPFVTDGALCRLVYHRSGGPMLCEFTSPTLAESGQTLTLSLPEQIFLIQRRKYPRITTPSPSCVTLNSAGVEGRSVSVADICMEGARLVINGALAPFFRQGTEIGPLTFSLHMQVPSMCIDALTIPSAQVVRIRELDNGMMLEVGIHFKAVGEVRESLDHYIQLRTNEEAADAAKTKGN